MGKLILDLKIGDTLHIGETQVQLKQKSGQAARLSISANQNIEINLMRKSASESTETQAHGKHTL